jgi:8-oxo-dGTP pyrophosphatase MutT (NUDIX family)
MNKSFSDFAPKDTEAGVGLALHDESDRYLFFLAGTRHLCPPGEIFYAGIGGHRGPGEDWMDCAHREVMEETGTRIEIFSSPFTWYIIQGGSVHQIQVIDRPRPLAFYEMIHPPGTPRVGELNRIVIYEERLCGVLKCYS